MTRNSRKTAVARLAAIDDDVPAPAPTRGRNTKRRRELLVGDWNIGFLVRDTHRQFRAHLRERLMHEPHILSLWSYLWALFKEDGLAQNELARRVRLVGPSVVSAINQMERLGLARRVRSETDRRVVHVWLTPKGRALESVMKDIAAELSDFALADLSDEEIATFCTLFARVRARLEPPE
jgi:DNA-binding MarR family transcriptional regulator